jgi:hypothetical protein
VADGHTVGEELQRADAIAADSGEKTVGIGAVGLCAFRKPAPDVVVVGQQVLEDGKDRVADVPVLAQGQREGHGDGVVPSKPVLVVLEIDRATAFAPEAADQPTIEIDPERNPGSSTRHQNSSSI